MPFVLLETSDFVGAATVAGADFGPWTQTNGWFKRDGSGNLVPQSPVNAAYIHKANSEFEGAVELDTGPWDASFDTNTIFGLIGRAVSPFTATGGGNTALDIYWARLAGNGRLYVYHGNSAVLADTEGVWTPTFGMSYTLRLEMRTGAAGHTFLTARVGDKDDPGVWLASTTANIDDATVNLNDSGGTYLLGIAGQPAANTPAAWKVTAVRLYEWVDDTAGPVFAAGVVHPSGTAFTLPISDDYSQPVLPAYGVTGLTFQARADSGSSWASFPTVGPIQISADTDYPGRVTGAFAEPLPAGWLIRANYTSVGGNITDSNSPANAAATQSAIAVTNYSTYDPDAVSDKGEIALGTRGIVGVLPDPGVSNHGVEAGCERRHELPYGAAGAEEGYDGWRMPFDGFSDGGTTLDTIIIKEAAVWIQQSPSEPVIRVPITFNDGDPDITIVHDTRIECDPIGLPVLPGGVVWTSLVDRCGDSATGLPWQTWFYTEEGVPGAEDRDGTLSGAYGALAGVSLTGNYDHTITGPFTTGSYCCRGYGPTAIVGKPHPSFNGTEIVAFVGGDSISKQFSDNSPNDSVLQTYRGWQGRGLDPHIPSVTFASFGSSAGGFAPEDQEYFFGGGGYTRKGTHFIYAWDVNSMRQSDDVDATWALFAGVLSQVVALGFLVVRTTITTYTTGDLSGQAATDGLVIASERRQELNNKVRWLLGTLEGWIGVFDMASVMEHDPVNGDNLRYDGAAGELHPTSVGHARMGGQVNHAVFVGNPNPILPESTALLVHTENVETGIRVYWDPDPRAVYYKVLRSSTELGFPNKMVIVDAPTVEYVDTAPQNGANYYSVSGVR